MLGRSSRALRKSATDVLGAHTEPVRITYVIGSLNRGGAETQLVRLANSLDRSRFNPSILCVWEGGELESSVAPDIRIFTAAMSNVRHGFLRSKAILAFRVFATMVRALRTHRPQIVHASMPSPYVVAGISAWLMRVPVVIAGRRALVSHEIYGKVRWRTLAQIANHVID